ncbi:PAS domain-containing protein [Halosegnis longus]|uniref:PAS domain-containing protein n=1 Tax=Halosegnis longus TaxID=2216012 RepID=A0AAJ4R7E6_9EURY|nr:PAS domain-containing protein [Halosegnis longus]RNJ25739.1 PAS domain-containing protein [Salella cibi]
MDAHRRSDTDDGAVRVALGFDSGRNRELLAQLLAQYDVIEFEASVPEETDLCIVDEGAFARLRDALTEWKADSQPTAAPALLVATGDETALWEEYGDAVGTAVDAIQSIPAPKRAIETRVSALLETREESKLATDRRNQLELYGRAMDGAEIGIIITEADGDYPVVYTNDGFLDITGYDREEVLGRNCRFLQGPDTDEQTRTELREALQSREQVSVEILNYRKSGEPFWNELEIVPVTEDGTVSHFIGFQRDITERKSRERILQRHQRIVQSVSDPILVLDPAGTIEYANDAAAQVFGAGTTDTAITTLFDEEQAGELMDTLMLALARDETHEQELTLPGDRHTYQFRFQPETLEGSRRVIVVARDITDIRRQQERLSVLDRVLRHNLRNKLNVVAGHAATLTDAPDSDPETIQSAGERISAAADSLLDIAEAVREFGDETSIDGQTGQQRDLAALVEQTVPRLEITYPDANVETVTPESAMAVCPDQIEFCLDKLFDDAIDRSGEASNITVSVIDRADVVELRVHDDGETMPQIERNALMTGSETPLEHTQGIALWLVRWAVEGVGGQFRVDAENGTTVTLSLPAG